MAAAVLLAVAAFVMWGAGTERAEDDELAQRYAAAIDGGPVQDDDPDRTAPLAVAGLASVLFLAGVIVLVSPSPDS